jgi:hypothetical protein
MKRRGQLNPLPAWTDKRGSTFADEGPIHSRRLFDFLLIVECDLDRLS